MKPKKKKLKLVEVEWLDADNGSGWTEYKKDIHQKGKCIKSYGLLVDKGETFVVLSFCCNEEGGDWLGTHSIPLGMVKKIRVIETVEP